MYLPEPEGMPRHSRHQSNLMTLTTIIGISASSPPSNLLVLQDSQSGLGIHMMNQHSSGSLLFPPEIWDSVCSFLPKPSLSQLRLVSSGLDHIARPWVYRTLRLEGFGSALSRLPSVPGFATWFKSSQWTPQLGPVSHITATATIHSPPPLLTLCPIYAAFPTSRPSTSDSMNIVARMIDGVSVSRRRGTFDMGCSKLCATASQACGLLIDR